MMYIAKLYNIEYKLYNEEKLKNIYNKLAAA